MNTATALQNNTAVPSQSISSPSHPGLRLQRKCACGGAISAPLAGECEQCAKRRLQTKLTIGASNDPLEQEADRIADQVMASPVHGAVSSAPVKVQRFTGNPSGQGMEVPASVERVLASPGGPLEPALRQDMEGRFGHDFSQVRVHTGGAAEQSARDVNAHAYTVGNNVVFGAGRFVPGTNEGRRLIAHELTHVVQQLETKPLLQRTINPDLPPTEVQFISTPTKKVIAKPLTKIEGNDRYSRGARPSSNVFRREFACLNGMPTERNQWVRAHLLHGKTDRSESRNLHGPGILENLIITDNSLNQQMRNGVENAALQKAYDDEKILWYESKVDSYAGNNFAQSISVKYRVYNQPTEGWGPEHGNNNIEDNANDIYWEPVISSGPYSLGRTSPPDCAGSPTQAAATLVRNYVIKTRSGDTTITGPERTTTSQLINLVDTPIQSVIPGLLLKRMILGSEAEERNNREDNIESSINISGTAPNNPVINELGRPGTAVRLKRGVRGPNEGVITIHPRQRIPFHSPYLSEAWIDNLQLENGAISGRGGLRPSLPLLSSRPMQLEFGPDRLRVFYGAAQRDVAQGGSSIRITQCTLGVDLLPEFRPSGELAFAMDSRGRDLLTGQVIASANQNGLIFDGTLNAHIPGTDEAIGEVHYQDGRWSGLVRVESSKIRLPGFQRGELQLNFSTNEQGALSLVPSGRVDLLIANQPITLEALYRNNQFLFSGSGRFNLPGLEPFEARVETNGTDVSFAGRTGVTIRDINGQVTIQYRNGRLSGDGTAAINKGRAQGTANLHLSERGRIYGDGRLSYRFTDSLTAAMGIAMDENQRIRVSGDITLDTIRLFERFPRDSSGRRRLFRTHFAVPIAGFTLGPLGDIGLVLAIDPELGVYYGIGPGEIRNARITTAFDPMADNPNFEFTAGAQIYIPFDAGFYLTIPASLTVGAVVASASAGLSASADIGLRGNFDANASLAYRQQIWSVETLAGVYANPRLALRIDGFLSAEALWGAGKIEKRWNLRNWEWGSNMRFGIEFPFRYVSNQPFQAPSFESIRFIYPENISFQTMIRDIVSQEG